MTEHEDETSTTPGLLFRHLASTLRRGITDGRWDAGSRLPPTRDLAREHHVSLNTVRKAISLLVDEGLVRAHQGSGVYVLPRQEQRDRSGVIGVLIPSHEYFTRSVDGIEQVTSAAGYRMSLACSQRDTAREQKLQDELIKSGVDGLILTPHHGEGRAAQLPVPTVLLERHPSSPEARVSSAYSDVAAGTRRAVTHLIDHGRRRVGFYGPASGDGMNDGERGYREALRMASIGVDPELVRRPRPSDTEHPNPSEHLTSYLTTALDRGMDAVVFGGEPWALMAFPILRKLEVRVPEDLAIMEYCDRHAADAEVPLSGIVQPRHAVGRIAARTLLDAIDAGSDAVVTETRLEPRLVIRESCGTARQTTGSAAAGKRGGAVRS